MKRPLVILCLFYLLPFQFKFFFISFIMKQQIVCLHLSWPMWLSRKKCKFIICLWIYSTECMFLNQPFWISFPYFHCLYFQSSDKQKIVRQFHFTSWPDRGVPKFASSIVNFCNKVRNTKSYCKGQTVVHCR